MCYFCLVSDQMLSWTLNTLISHPRGPWKVTCDTVMESKCFTDILFYSPKSMFLLFKPPQAPELRKNSICCKYLEFLQPSNSIHFEFLWHFQTQMLSYSRRQWDLLATLPHTPPMPLPHKHIYTHMHIDPLRWIPDLEFNAFLFRITSQECSTRATSLITLSWWMWGCLKERMMMGCRRFGGAHPVQYLTLFAKSNVSAAVVCARAHLDHRFGNIVCVCLFGLSRLTQINNCCTIRGRMEWINLAGDHTTGCWSKSGDFTT